jgi:hypothetical protein
MDCGRIIRHLLLRLSCCRCRNVAQFPYLPELKDQDVEAGDDQGDKRQGKAPEQESPEGKRGHPLLRRQSGDDEVGGGSYEGEVAPRQAPRDSDHHSGSTVAAS